MLYRFLTVALFFTTYCCWGQQRLAGKVQDAATKQAVPYVSISVLGQPVGTSSNAEGEFELTTRLPARLVISDLSHQRDTVLVTGAAALPLQLRLQPASIMLPEVQVGNYVGELIKKAYRQLSQHTAYTTYGQAFYRQTTKLDGDITEIQEMIWNTKSNNLGLLGTALVQGRYGEKKSLIGYRDFSLYTKIAGISSPGSDSASSTSIISLNAARYYDLNVASVTQSGSQQLVEISFASKPGINPRHYKGSVTIDENTNQILRLRIETPDIHTKSNNPTFTYKDELTSFELVFQPAVAGATTLEHVKVSYQAAINRPFKKDVQMQVTSFTYLYTANSKPSGLTYAPAAAGRSDIEDIKRTTYDAEFWKKNPVVKRTPQEEETVSSFEKQGAFGTLFKN